MGYFHVSPGNITTECKGDAARAAKGWNDRKTIWTDRAAAVWRQEGGDIPPHGFAQGYIPQVRIVGWSGRRFHLGKNKEVFDAELFMLYQAAKTFDNRNERNQDYTDFFGSQLCSIGRHSHCGCYYGSLN